MYVETRETLLEEIKDVLKIMDTLEFCKSMRKKTNNYTLPERFGTRYLEKVLLKMKKQSLSICTKVELLLILDKLHAAPLKAICYIDRRGEFYDFDIYLTQNNEEF